ncbi:MAG: hypothetical protein QOC70_194 [Verrucomicrobiota bacterium]|jgi:hypothetical protein
MNKHHPFHPIIYVRGFAATQGEIEETVADPYMGFNVGSTKARMVWSGELKRFYFESPLVRLMSDHKYDDVFVAGEDLLMLEKSDRLLDYRCIIIYRYYDEASEAFGAGDTPPIQHFGKGLNELILRLRDKICENPKNEVTPDEFRCYLVAHSMGGLVCRAFLQGKDNKGNPLGSDETRKCVDKFFTYATPHNGIDLRIVRNVPGWVTFGDVNNFNRDKIAGYLDLPKKSKDVSVVHTFPPERIFNLVGTNPSDYRVLGGLSAWAAGDASDGLVRIDDATTHGPSGPDCRDVASPRAFVHRSHSGHYGIVNSEEGYQNLTRFLFGDIRVDGILDIDDITLPPVVQEAFNAGKVVKASYQFEIVVSVRGCQWQMHRRTQRENSAIFRTYDELFPGKPGEARPPDRSKSPHLFSVFLDPTKSVAPDQAPTADGVDMRPVSFAFDLRVMVPDYEVDGILFLKKHYEGGFIYRELIVIEAERATPEGPWKIRYGFHKDSPSEPNIDAVTHPLENEERGLTFNIPITQETKPGLTGTLRIEVRPWE